MASVALISTKVKGSKGPEILTHLPASTATGSSPPACCGRSASLLFIWFLGSLRSRYLAAEGGAGRLTALAYGGGIAAATIAMLIPVADEVGALNKDDIDASGASVLHHFSDGFFVAAEYTLPVFFFASAILVLRYAVLPKWLGWFSILIGIVLLIGPIGWAAFIFATPIWILIVSVWLYLRTPAAAPTPAPTPA